MAEKDIWNGSSDEAFCWSGAPPWEWPPPIRHDQPVEIKLRDSRRAHNGFLADPTSEEIASRALLLESPKQIKNNSLDFGCKGQ